MHQSKPDDPPLFYAVCQAVMLIFCFRWRAFGNDKDGESVLGEMELEVESVEGPCTGSVYLTGMRRKPR
jgi:hypothetical protein